MKTSVHSNKIFLGIAMALVTMLSFHNSTAQSGSGGGSSVPAPELVFQNPVLTSGTEKTEGAVYRFTNVTTNVDAELKMRKFSHSTIEIEHIDQPDAGWAKAFQPKFGIAGSIAPNEDWYIDFEMTFFKAGTSEKKIMPNIAVTALDIDGSANNIVEYVIYDKPGSVSYSPVTYLTSTPMGDLGQHLMCGQCSVTSALVNCSNCSGSGLNSGSECGSCRGSGKRHGQCGHAYTGPTGSLVSGSLEEFNGIDTSGTQVMVTYKYQNKETIRFRYGGRSGPDGGWGIRQNSSWFREFSLAPPATLPVSLVKFTAMLDKQTAIINWATAYEENVSHFEIERSTDGKTYTRIATAFSLGTSNYTYKDVNVGSPTGLIYYRLRSVDNTKESSLSQVRVIRLGKEQEAIALTTYPNPAIDFVRVSLPNEWQNRPVSLELFTASGIKVQSQQIKSASQTETMQVSKASRGMYIIKASCEGQTAQQRILKN
jgi:hypothetical protein